MPKVRVYTTPICPYCAALKDFLKDHNIEFEEIDLSQDLEKQTEIIKKTKQMMVPVVEIDGEFIVGFEKEKIVKLLNIKD